MEPRRLQLLGMAWAAMFVLPAAAALEPAPSGVEAWLAQVEAGALPDCAPPAVVTRDLPAELASLGAAAEGLPPNLLEPCNGIRPGGRLTNGCTLNFVYTDGASLYIGTAGHCTSSVGQRMSTQATGQFGSVVYRINGGQGNDFALIRIDADKVAGTNPTLCVWGGPTGAHTGDDLVGDAVLYQYGWGVATQFVGPTRARAHANVFHDDEIATWVGVGSGGDSGAPLITSGGEAYVIHTHGITPVVGVIGESGTYIHRALLLARNAGFNVNVVPGAFDADAAARLADLGA